MAPGDLSAVVTVVLLTVVYLCTFHSFTLEEENNGFEETIMQEKAESLPPKKK